MCRILYSIDSYLYVSCSGSIISVWEERASLSAIVYLWLCGFCIHGFCIMAKFGCPPRYIAMVRQFHDGMQARVQNDGEYSEPFPVTNGVKQGCVMAPTLFSMMFSAMLTDAFQDIDAGFPIRLLNLRRLQAKSKVQTDVVDKLFYADDLVENAKSEEKCKGL